LANRSDDIIEELADQLSLSSQAFASTGLRSFYDRDISDFTDRDQIKVRNVVKHHMRQMIVEREVMEDAVAAVTPSMINQALKAARDELLSDKTNITLKAKDFIRDHCVC